MGVAGSGKTTIGTRLATALGWQFADADDFHPSENIAKMRQGIPLTDSDRQPWLAALHQAIVGWLEVQTPTVLACSALKQAYRHALVQNADQVKLIYLKGSPALLQLRLGARQGHYMPVTLLQSQFEALEEPQTALVIDAALSPATIVQVIRSELKL